ncbi:uncharacterized protein [Macrobrachium rosenbergii]|uniref:uncharacterized protein n=1 Tax=Macrobrachium rosenbergii TaxID=79674 RepID=UPI0034D3A8D9
MENLQNQEVTFAANRDIGSVSKESLHRPPVRLQFLSRNRTRMKLSVASATNHFISSNSHDSMSFMISITLWQILNTKASECNFMVATMDSDQPLVAEIMRQSFTSTVPMVMLDMSSKTQVPSERLLRDAWGSTAFTCHTLVIDLTSDSDLQILSDLDKQKLWLWPYANVLLVGTSEKARSATQHPTLRNTIQPLYLGIEEKPSKNSLSREKHIGIWKFSQSFQRSMVDFPLQTAKEYVRLHIRCLYCNNGHPKTLLVLSWELGLELPELIISDHSENFQGHRMRVVCFPIEPISNFIQSKDGPGGVVTLIDSFDKRLLEALSAGMNFTYDVRSPKDMQLGYRLENGSWTGAVGAIYNNEADFSTLIGTNPERATFMDLKTTIYIDQIMITSLKPQLLPEYLAFFRPLTGGYFSFLPIIMSGLPFSVDLFIIYFFRRSHLVIIETIQSISNEKQEETKSNMSNNNCEVTQPVECNK